MLLSISTFSSLPPPLSSSFFLTKTTVQCPAQKHISHHLSRADSDCSTNENLRFATGKMLLPSTDEKVIPESTKHLPQPLHCPQQRLLEEKGLRTTQKTCWNNNSAKRPKESNQHGLTCPHGDIILVRRQGLITKGRSH